MSFGWTLASILIPTVVCGITAVCLCLADRCDHTLYPKIHTGSGRIFLVCRCGQHFER